MFLLFVTLALSGAIAPPQASRLVAENGAKYAFRDGVIELRASRGVLRWPRPVLDFDLAFEVRALTPTANPGLLVRMWPDQWKGLEGYRLELPVVPGVDAQVKLVGIRHEAETIEASRPQVLPQGEWQRVDVTGARDRIRVTVNGVVAGDYRVDLFGGYLAFDNREGTVEIRNVSANFRDPNETLPDGVISYEALQKAGGRLPVVAREVTPRYTAAAMRAMVQGDVRVDAVVLPDGSVGPARVAKSLHPDLDLSALAAVRAWRFHPGSVNGTPVPVIVEVRLSFSLR